MSEGAKSNQDDDFDIRLWMIDLQKTDAGQKKIISNDIKDEGILTKLASTDIAAIKLSVGDNRRFLDGVAAIKASQGGEQPIPTPANPSDGTLNSQETPVTAGQKSSFTVEEVARFLAGNTVPTNVQASMVTGQSLQLNQPPTANLPTLGAVNQVGYSARLPYPPVDNYSNLSFPRCPPFDNYRAPVAYQGQGQGQVQVQGQGQGQGLHYYPWQSANGDGYQGNAQQQPYPYMQPNYNIHGTVPLYSPYRHPFVPGRLANTNSLSRDQHLQTLSAGYQSHGMHALLGVNEYNPRTGEALFLPCNFVSHVRGTLRVEEEELLQTTNGTKSQSKKILPEKLSYGLFFGANARILARLIPNLTPELHAYLDYLRKLGDLMVNYTASSVFLLDHEHRFKIIEQVDAKWNLIDPTLSLNILKKRDAVSGLSSSSTVSRVATNNSTGRQSVTRPSTVICWQYNQQDGCVFHPNCRFVHICNIVGCGLEHPAYKHVFRPSSLQPSTSTRQDTGASAKAK
jgi:hypothetical protein